MPSRRRSSLRKKAYRFVKKGSKRVSKRTNKFLSKRRTSKRAMTKGEWSLSRALSRTAKLAAAAGTGYVAGKVGRSIHRKYKNYRSRKNMERARKAVYNQLHTKFNAPVSNMRRGEAA